MKLMVKCAKHEKRIRSGIGGLFSKASEIRLCTKQIDEARNQ